MSALQKFTVTILSLLLLAIAWGLWNTRDPNVPAAPVVPAARGGMPVIDQTTLATAQRLQQLASTPEEQPLAQAALQTADHELDLAFMGALRAIESHPPVLSPEAQQIQVRLADAQKRLARDTDVLDDLAQKMGKASDAEKPDLQDKLDLIGSQIELEKDEIEEADSDLLAAGGNVHQRIQKAQEEHEAAERAPPPVAAAPTSAPAAALNSLRGMVAQARQWLALHHKRTALEGARHAASDSAATLDQQRQQIVDDLVAVRQKLTALGVKDTSLAGDGTDTAPVAAPPPHANHAARSGAPAAAPGATAATDVQLALTRQLAVDQRRLLLREQRISARHKLADIYGRWEGVVAAQQRGVVREFLGSAAVVLVALLLLLFADRWLSGLLGRARIDRRQLATLRSVVGVALQVIGILLILFMLVGLPGQFGTMLGIAGAGLTVALKDFIVAFIGWFVLMGKNGIRLGDWVEINGVSGEVVELSVFHTVLLETGNWTDAGHPTGRRVTFTNSFAIEGHYFNFSTSGQWLWDELTVVVPFGRDPHAVAEAIEKEVTAATADSARQAEAEWQRASRGQRGTLLAQPGIAVRPASGGVEIAVRYVTRANERYALRAKLYQSAVQLLAQAPAK
ncbi:MAG: mechanosensitive ion channel [Proteobacteria bacterium]|nr:mechanosensitive ion channel [Pseudomonadota bacterium]